MAIYKAIQCADAWIENPNLSITRQWVSSAEKPFTRFEKIIIPEGKQIQSIIVKYNIESAVDTLNDNLNVFLDIVDGLWNEQTLTFNNKPTTTSFINFTMEKVATQQTINITGISIDKLNTFGIAVSNAFIYNNASTNFKWSNRFVLGSEPFLDVTFEDKPPTPPTITQPVNGQVIDQNTINRISWVTSESQTGFIISYSTDNVIFTDINIDSTNKFYDFSSGFFSLGILYLKVKVKVGALISQYSDTKIITVANKPTAPTALTNGTIDGALPLLIASGVSVTEFEIILLEGTVELINKTITGTSISYQVVELLKNNTTYNLKVRYKDTNNLWSDQSTSSFNTVFVTPIAPVVTVADSGYYMRIDVSGGTATKHELYKQINGAFGKIADMTPTDTFNDFFVRSNKDTNYFIRSFTASNGYIDSSILTEKLTFLDSYLITVDTTFGLELMYEPRKSQTVSRKSQSFDLVNRTAPFTIFSSIIENYMSELSFLVFDKLQIDALNNIVKHGEICCFRDGRGTLVFLVVNSVVTTHSEFGRYLVSISTSPIDFNEVI